MYSVKSILVKYGRIIFVIWTIIGWTWKSCLIYKHSEVQVPYKAVAQAAFYGGISEIIWYAGALLAYQILTLLYRNYKKNRNYFPSIIQE